MNACVVIESSAWIAYLKGQDSPLLEVALGSGSVLVPALCLVELIGASETTIQRAQLEKLFESLPIWPDDGQARAHYARAAKLRSELALRGFSLSARDAHIVQCALDTKGILLTKDNFFGELQKYTGVALSL